MWTVCILLFVYFLASPTPARESVKSALSLCAYALIPALFPTAVTVNIINSSGLSDMIAYTFGRPLSKALSIKREAVSAVIMSFAGGFPIGAICTRRLYSEGLLTKSEAERLLTFTGVASPAFCIGVIGNSLYGDVGFGIRMYIYQASAALLTAVATGKCRNDDKISAPRLCRSSLSEVLTAAVTEGGLTMLKVCSFTVFFAVIGDAVCSIAGHYSGNVVSALCASLCELTLASKRCALIGGRLGKALCGFAVGFSGLSVHMQTASVMSGSGVCLTKYHISKVLHGAFSAAAAALLG